MLREVAAGATPASAAAGKHARIDPLAAGARPPFHRHV
jgi:hypothetical protein